MVLDPITAILDVGSKVIDKLWPDKADADRAKIELLKLTQDGEFKELETRYSAILAEANSQHKLVALARPSFLYVMYFMIVMSVPMGFLAFYNPELAKTISTGMRQWLDGIPDLMWNTFMYGYLGYSAARSWDKYKGAK